MIKIISKVLVVLTILCVNLLGASTSKNQCDKKNGDFIYASGECIQYYKSEGEIENAITILVHGTWPEGTNILARYAPFAQNLAIQTDVTTIAIALPGYSNSSTNRFKALVHKDMKSSANQKEYIKFLSTLVKSLKEKFNAKKVTYVGHSAGATIGTKLATISTNLVNNLVLVGGKYDVDVKTLDKKAKYILVYGTKDKISKPEVTKEFYNKTKKANLKVNIVKIQDGVHLDLDMRDESLDAIIELLED